MKKSVFYIAWGALYCLCVGFGFLSEPRGIGKALLVLLSLLFFLPPYLLLWQAKKATDRKTLLVLRSVSSCILALTLLLLVLNLLSVYVSPEAGLTLHVLLVMFSAPMVCGQYWVLSLFLWALLLMLTLPTKRPCQK